MPSPSPRSSAHVLIMDDLWTPRAALRPGFVSHRGPGVYSRDDRSARENPLRRPRDRMARRPKPSARSSARFAPRWSRRAIARRYRRRARAACPRCRRAHDRNRSGAQALACGRRAAIVVEQRSARRNSRQRIPRAHRSVASSRASSHNARGRAPTGLPNPAESDFPRALPSRASHFRHFRFRRPQRRSFGPARRARRSCARRHRDSPAARRGEAPRGQADLEFRRR